MCLETRCFTKRDVFVSTRDFTVFRIGPDFVGLEVIREDDYEGPLIEISRKV